MVGTLSSLRLSSVGPNKRCSASPSSAKLELLVSVDDTEVVEVVRVVAALAVVRLSAAMLCEVKGECEKREREETGLAWRAIA